MNHRCCALRRTTRLAFSFAVSLACSLSGNHLGCSFKFCTTTSCEDYQFLWGYFLNIAMRWRHGRTHGPTCVSGSKVRQHYHACPNSCHLA